MDYEEIYGPDKSFEQIIYKTVNDLMTILNLEDFEPDENGFYKDSQANLICKKFKTILSGNTYWNTKSPASGEENIFILILKSTSPVSSSVCIKFVFTSGKIKIIRPEQNVVDISLNFTQMWLSFKELRESLIKVLIGTVKMAHDLK